MEPSTSRASDPASPSSPSGAPGPSGLSGAPEPSSPMDEARVERMQRAVEGAVSLEARQRIMHILGQVNALGGVEKLLLYLKLPAGTPTVDPLKQPVNPLGSRAEIHQTVMWIQTHLEVDREISLPKQDVYNEYLQYCTSTNMKALSTADFGKVMKQVYPCVKPRRLGTRGNSRYCYAGMRKRVKLEAPQLPDLFEKSKTAETLPVRSDLSIATSELIREWAEKTLGLKFMNLQELACHLVEKEFVDSTSNSALMIMNAITNFDESGNTTDDYDNQKSQQRGVIKQLKRKIQSQPQPGTSKSLIVKKSKTQNNPEINCDLQEQPSCSRSMSTDTSIKKELDVASVTVQLSGEDQIKDYTIRKNLNGNIVEDAPLPQPFNVNHSSFSQAVNLAPPLLSRNHNSPLMNTMKNITRPIGYDDPYKFDSTNIPSQPTNLSLNSYVNYNNEITLHSAFNSNLPINLSHSNIDNENISRLCKTVVPNKNLELATPCENNTLNLTTAKREHVWHSNIIHQSPSTRLPLPGKKMILEIYNNENQSHSSQPYYETQTMKRSSPNMIANIVNQCEYLPKKMRATESFGGKLAASRLSQHTITNVPVVETEKYNKTSIEKVPENLPQIPAGSQMEPPTFKLNTESSKPSLIDNSRSLDTSNNIISLDIVSVGKKSTPKEEFYKNPKRSYKRTKSQNNAEHLTDKPPTRGRPRKKSLSKAKYTRRQPKGENGSNVQCDHTKHPKRSSDSCCSLTDAINIKTGIICREKHAEILNRERMSSICNMDKHALDDYLNESSSQENEEELMKYFQQNTENVPNDETNKELSHNDEESKNKLESVNTTDRFCNDGSEPRLKDSLIVAEDGDFLDITHEDQNQYKDAKISQLRELLKKNFNSNVIASRNLDVDMKANLCNFNNSSNGAESAFTSINKKALMSSESDFNDVSASASLSMLSKRQASNATERPINVNSFPLENARRRVSFDNVVPENSTVKSNRASPVYNYCKQTMPHSPTSRAQHYNFMPISPSLSPGPLSPIYSNKNSPVVNPCNRAASPSRAIKPPVLCTSPSASPFVSPGNTPVPRARTACQTKPVPSKLQVRKMNKLQFNLSDTPHFVMPNDQRSPNFNTKIKNYPMSAPPSPNILTPKYKPNFPGPSLASISPQITPSVIQIHSMQSQLNVSPCDQVHTATDPLSHEVSKLFSETNVSSETNSLRSQSVPLNQDGTLSYFNQESTVKQTSNVNFLSYNNTPCNSIPATPVPREFCDFGTLADTCEVGLNSENLDKIYNVLDSNVVKQNDIMINQAASDDLALSNFTQSDSNAIIEPLILEPPHSEPNDFLKRSNSVESDIDDMSFENRFFVSRSVPSTPLPCSKSTFQKHFQTYQEEYNNNNTCRKVLSSSKSVPSTPLLTDDQNVFSYSNRDFLINGNSVDRNISTALNDKDKSDSSVLADLSGSPLRETIDELASFNDECIDIASELPAFTSQGIAGENDYLGDLDMI